MECHFQSIKVTLIDKGSMYTGMSSSGSCLKLLSWWYGCAMCWVEAELYYMHVGRTLPCCSMMIGQKWPYICIYSYISCALKRLEEFRCEKSRFLHTSPLLLWTLDVIFTLQKLVESLSPCLHSMFFLLKSFWWSFGLGLMDLVYSWLLQAETPTPSSEVFWPSTRLIHPLQVQLLASTMML